MTKEVETVSRVFRIWAWLEVGLGVLMGAIAGVQILKGRGSMAEVLILPLVAGVPLGLGLLTFWTAWALKRRDPRARTLALGLGILALPVFPIGSLVGYFALAVLLRPEVRAEFGTTR